MTRLPGERLDRRRVAVTADDGAAPRVGVLALQGDVLEHVRALREVGLDPVGVRTAEQLASVVGLVLPGGESTAISRAAERSGLSGPLAERIRDGMPVLGTCAGLILLSDELDGDDDTMPRPRGLAVRTRRNAYGSQVDSFDVRFAVAGVDGGTMEASFIRAPRIETILDQSVTVLAEVDGAPVAVRQGAITGLTFHPEVSGDLRMHARFAEDVLAAVAREAAR